MNIAADALLERLARQLRRDIAPSVDDEFARTQAYMAAVILERLAREAAMGERHRAAERANVAQLVTELGRILRPGTTQASESLPEDVRDALAKVSTEGTVMALGPLTEALYRWGSEHPAAGAALAALRAVLRSDIDRRMEIAR